MADRRVGRGRKAGQIAGAVIVSLLALFLLAMTAGILYSDVPALAWLFGVLGLFLAGLTWWLWSTLGLIWASRIGFDDDAFRARIPSWRSLVYTGPMRNLRIPYAEIRAIERRDEIYRFLFIPSLLTAFLLVTDKGERVTFGLKSDLADDLDFESVAAELSGRTGIPITDRGVIEATGLPGFRLHRPPLDAAPLPPAQGQRKRAIARAMLQVAFLLMMIAGAVKACAEM